MMRTFALARASYRFWHENGAQYMQRLGKAVNPQFTLAKVDTSDDFSCDGAALIDLETMVVCAAGGATAIIAVEASGAASAIQFVYDNRQTLWGGLTNDYVWRMWFNGFLFW
jgi:hypothetical protein